jgi:hypothetical protein
MIRYKIADVVFDAKIKYRYTKELCKDYEYSGDEQPCFVAEVTEEDILHESSLSVEQFPPAYLESLALFRKLCNYCLENANGIIFHSSAIAVDGQAYLFTAPSGTGKSTHARLWRELLGDKVIMVNDDKPIVRLIDGEFYVYGTPWNGKHRLSTNCKMKIKAICAINQAKENSIRPASTGEMLMVILNQTIRPKELDNMDKLLSLIEGLLTKVDIYRLGCNISEEAAQLSYKTMSGREL